MCTIIKLYVFNPSYVSLGIFHSFSSRQQLLQNVKRYNSIMTKNMIFYVILLGEMNYFLNCLLNNIFIKIIYFIFVLIDVLNLYIFQEIIIQT